MAGAEPQHVYDVIIVGAGPAGCVLASRLSEIGDKRVLLLEAGPDCTRPGFEHADLTDPFALTASYNSNFHWPGIKAKVSAASPNDRARPLQSYIQGFGVGGGSNINGMAADRALPGDYDEWESLGAAGWGWADVAPYYSKLERDLDFSGPEHGAEGPMPIRRQPRASWPPFAAALGEAIEARGYPLLGDYNADFRDGLSAVPTNCLPHRRVSASMAYLDESVRRRSNLEIWPDTKAERLLIEAGCTAGVIARAQGRTALVRAKQVILACGAIQSPALLLRSGIGPGPQLRRHGIEVVRHLPGVGENLQNHPSVTLTAYLPREAAQPREIAYFLQNWLRFSSHRADCPPHDMHLMVFNKGAWHRLGHRIGMVTVTVLKAYSAGSVTLDSANPNAAPQVDFKLLSEPRDFDRLVSGLRFAFELLMAPGVAEVRRELFIPDQGLVERLSRRNLFNRLQSLVISTVLDLAPLRRVLLGQARLDPAALLADESALRAFVAHTAAPQFHVCGTCRMGRADDEAAVVDAYGRVHGLGALRVVDASIFPTIPRGYTHLPVIMAAEKLSDAVKADWAGVQHGT